MIDRTTIRPLDRIVARDHTWLVTRCEQSFADGLQHYGLPLRGELSGSRNASGELNEFLIDTTEARWA